MKKIIALILILALIAGGVFLVKKKRAELAALPTPTLPPLVIKVVTPKKRLVRQEKSFLATYHTLQKALIATKFAGKIAKIYVQEGQSVQKGALLAKLDSSSIEAAIASAKAKLEATKAALASTKAQLTADRAALEVAFDAYKRAQKLYSAQAISKEALQKAKATYLAQKAKLTATKNMLEAKKIELQAATEGLKAKQSDLAYTIIKAPFDGTIEHLFFKEGSFAPLGKPIVSLLGERKVFDIAYDSGIEPGMKISDYPSCKIDTLLPYSKNSLNIARSYCKAPLKEESTVTLRIVQKEQSDVALPLNALYEKSGKTYVFVYKGGKLQPRNVKVAVLGKNFFIPEPIIDDPVAVGTHSELGKLFFTDNVKVVRE